MLRAEHAVRLFLMEMLLSVHWPMTLAVSKATSAAEAKERDIEVQHMILFLQDAYTSFIYGR